MIPEANKFGISKEWDIMRPLVGVEIKITDIMMYGGGTGLFLAMLMGGWGRAGRWVRRRKPFGVDLRNEEMKTEDSALDTLRDRLPPESDIKHGER